MAKKRIATMNRSETPSEQPKASPTSEEAPFIRRANLARNVVTVENFESYYTNDIQLQTTPWDVRIVIGRIADLGLNEADSSATIHRLAEIHMSPQMAKKLTLLLINQLRTYEERMGEIPQPKD